MVSGDKQKELLLNLLSALSELDGDGGLEEGARLEPIAVVDVADPRVKKKAFENKATKICKAWVFHRFAREINHLDDALRNFSNSARLLGSSVDILSSTYHLRERLTVIRYLFRENAAHLFPRKIAHAPEESLHRPAIPDRRRSQSKVHSNTRRLPILDPPTHEDFPKELDMLARDMMAFLLDFNDLLDYPDEALNLPVMSFEEDVKYWASCLKAYDGQLKSPPVRRYLHELTTEMGEHLESIGRYLSTFNETCIPTIRDMQRHGARNLLNLSMLATVFCAVAATTLQFSYAAHGNSLDNAVNGFWFTSIVLSIAAAGNSLLGLAWKQAMYRAPGKHVPWWVISWLRRSPLVFLVLSVTCFTVGLAIFSYSSMQEHTVVIVVAGVSGLSSIGFTTVITWYALERIAFARHYGSRLHEFRRLYAMLSWVIHPCKVVARFLVRRQVVEDAENAPPSSDPSTPRSTSDEQKVRLGPAAHVSGSLPAHNTIRAAYPVRVGHPTVHASTDLSRGSVALSPGRARFQNAVRAVLAMKDVFGDNSPHNLGWTTMPSSVVSSNSTNTPEPPSVGMQQSTRASTLATRLRSLRPAESVSAHTALVRHLQFSPNGKLLATSSWDRTSVILQVVSPFTPHRTLAHPSGFVSEVAWSPSGTRLLTKLKSSVKVWTENGVCVRTIERGCQIQSITWMPQGEGFMVVEGDSITLLDLSGQQVEQHKFDRLKIHGMAVTADGLRVLVVGTLQSSEDGLRPGKSRDEKRIISYNLERKRVESQVPVLDDVRDITLAKSGLYALVSYECRAPQLWKLETYKQRSEMDGLSSTQGPPSTPVATSRLSLECTYTPHIPEGLSATGCFGGADDELVLCASKAGDIHIWVRESGLLVHHFCARELGGSDITCIAWHPAAGTYTFATGSHDGAVRVWTTAAPGDTAPTPGESD
ncbi:WD40 repeat-like protein [Peniophora sp. CONT]|nr:WD40 repeat-like protein [Peniophora sp. CONT]